MKARNKKADQSSRSEQAGGGGAERTFGGEQNLIQPDVQPSTSPSGKKRRPPINAAAPTTEVDISVWQKLLPADVASPKISKQMSAGGNDECVDKAWQMLRTHLAPRVDACRATTKPALGDCAVCTTLHQPISFACSQTQTGGSHL